MGNMIQSLSCAETRDLFTGLNVALFASIRSIAERKLAMLNRSVRLDDLRIPPNNRLEALKGDRKGTHSIRINEQWRLCFRFEGGHAYEVQIVDYH
jgi:proteic killer suppression protein